MNVTRLTRRVAGRLVSGLARLLSARSALPCRYASLWLRGALEKEMGWLDRIVRPTGIAIDIGANMGLYSYRLGQLCLGVEAFEPNPGPRAVLEAYGRRNIRIHSVALSSAEGNAKLYIPVLHGREQTGFATLQSKPMREYVELDVVTRRLDSYNFTNVCLIKIDVEGHELDVLRGALATVRTNRPVLLIELEERHQSLPIQIIFDWIRSLGYNGFFVLHGDLEPISHFDVEQHQRAYLHGQLQASYINNFFFMPSD